MNNETKEIEIQATKEIAGEQEIIQDQNPQQEKNLEDNQETKRPLAYYLTWLLFCIVVFVSGIFSYYFFPFTQKVAGTWTTTDGTMLLQSHGDNWQLELPNYQNTQGITLIFSGKWQTSDVNKYDGKDVSVQLKIEKSQFSETELESLTEKNELYKIAKQTKKALFLAYTKKGLEQIQMVSNMDQQIHFSLENEGWEKAQQKLFLNSQYFSKERIAFSRENK